MICCGNDTGAHNQKKSTVEVTLFVFLIRKNQTEDPPATGPAAGALPEVITLAESAPPRTNVPPDTTPLPPLQVREKLCSVLGARSTLP
jgi:hypothetical protein